MHALRLKADAYLCHSPVFDIDLSRSLLPPQLVKETEAHLDCVSINVWILSHVRVCETVMGSYIYTEF